MQTRGAIVRQAPGKYEVVDLEVDDPRENEVQVKMVASGMCHSDDHPATGDMPVGIYPMAGGHEGAGIVRIKSIRGPGACGADFPLRVSELGEGTTTLGYSDDMRPPGSM